MRFPIRMFVKNGGERFVIIDTGTTIPILIIEGDASLLSERAPEDMILPENDAPLYDEVIAVFEDEL